MKSSALLALYDDTMRRDARVAGCTREKTAQTSRYSTASGSLRYVMWHRLLSSDTDRCIIEEISAATGNVQALMWKVYSHDTPINLSENLLAHGFTDHDPYTLMVAPVARVLAELGAPPSHICVRQLREANELDAYQEIWDSVWPTAPNARYVNDYRRVAANREPGVVFFAGFSVAKEPISSGYVFHAPGSPFALLCGGATKAAWRNQHAYSSMLIARAKCALERGADYLAVEASPASQPILERLSFERLSTLFFYEKCLANVSASMPLLNAALPESLITHPPSHSPLSPPAPT